MPKSVAVTNAIPTFGTDGWYSRLFGYPRREEEVVQDTGDSEWPTLLDHNEDPQLAEWDSLKERVVVEDEEPVVEDSLPSLVRADSDVDDTEEGILTTQCPSTQIVANISS
jgi:hypothetical protein